MNLTPGSFILRNYASNSLSATAVDFIAGCPGCGTDVVWTQSAMPSSSFGSRIPTPGPCVSCADTDIGDEVA